MRVFKQIEPVKTLKNVSISLITLLIGITQKCYCTLQKALNIGNLSLENIQYPILKSYSKGHTSTMEVCQLVEKG